MECLLCLIKGTLIRHHQSNFLHSRFGTLNFNLPLKVGPDQNNIYTYIEFKCGKKYVSHVKMWF
jgi:hypothetical protein